MRNTKEEIEIARERLLKLLPPGKTVYTIVKHVSSSGMTRHISLMIAGNDQDGKPAISNIDWEASKLLGWRRNPKNGALVVGGCGMDMGFHTVYSLSSRLYPDGFKLPKGKHGRNGDKSGFDKDGGYALNHKWI